MSFGGALGSTSISVSGDSEEGASEDASVSDLFSLCCSNSGSALAFSAERLNGGGGPSALEVLVN